MPRRVKTILAVSLIGNIFLAGVMGGGLLMLARQGGWRLQAGVPGRPIRAAGDGLPSPERERFRETMLHVLQSNRDLLRMARESRQVAARLFVQPQFDQAAVVAALGQARDADIQLRIRVETAATAFAAGLPADERQVLAQGLERGGPLRHPPEPDRIAAPVR